ncbi:MAG: SRPBCC family protein [Haloferacaceae archaeon]
MEEISVSTVVYLPPEEVYDFLVDFPGYANYSKHLRSVRAVGDGSPGTRYALEFAWWKLTYTAHSEVTGVDPPTRIDWRVTRDLDAEGCWRVEPLDSLPADAPADADRACRVYFDVVYDPDSVDSGILDLPRLVSLDWIVQKVVPVVEREAERVVSRIVADVEGRRRPVEVEVHARPTDS